MPHATALLPAAEPARSDKLRPNWMLSGPKNESSVLPDLRALES